MAIVKKIRQQYLDTFPNTGVSLLLNHFEDVSLVRKYLSGGLLKLCNMDHCKSRNPLVSINLSDDVRVVIT